MTAGYSGKPLFEKLGIKKEMKIQLIEPPKEYFTLLQQNVSSQFCKKNEMPDFIHLFVKTNNEFDN
ncbi:MAG: hypothetical protein WKF59_05640 [Chitinophagaceae bacterium]